MRLFGRNKNTKPRNQIEELAPVENDPVSLFLEQRRLAEGDGNLKAEVEIPEMQDELPAGFPDEEQIPSGDPRIIPGEKREEQNILNTGHTRLSQAREKENNGQGESFDPLLSLIRVAKDALLEDKIISDEKSGENLKSPLFDEIEPAAIEELPTPSNKIATISPVRTLDEPGFAFEEAILPEDSPASGNDFEKGPPPVQEYTVDIPVEMPEPVVTERVVSDIGKTERNQSQSEVSDTVKPQDSNQLVAVQAEVKAEPVPVQPEATIAESQPAQPENPPEEKLPNQPGTSGILDIFREEVGDKGHGLAVELEEIDIHELLKEAIHVKNMLNRRSGISENG